MTKVKNIKTTSVIRSKTDNLLKYWEKKSGKCATVCCEKSCTNKDLNGAIVEIANTNIVQYYIIPFCNFHCNSDEELDVLEIMVKANRQLHIEEYSEMYNNG